MNSIEVKQKLRTDPVQDLLETYQMLPLLTWWCISFCHSIPWTGQSKQRKRKCGGERSSRLEYLQHLAHQSPLNHSYSSNLMDRGRKTKAWCWSCWRRFSHQGTDCGSQLDEFNILYIGIWMKKKVDQEKRMYCLWIHLMNAQMQPQLQLCKWWVLNTWLLDLPIFTAEFLQLF